MDDQRAEIERALALEGFSFEEKEAIIDEVEQRIGSRPFENLPDWQAEEFQKIIYDDIAHIEWWLNENAPDYRESDEFKDAVEVAAEDGNPDNIRPEKIYATLKWIEKNIPDYDQIYDKVLQDAVGEDWSAWLKDNG